MSKEFIFAFKMLPKDYIIHHHCFTGDLEQAQQWIDAFPNLYFGFTPILTQTSWRLCKLKQVALALPLKRILLETDAPYFRPHYVSSFCKVT